MDGDEFAGLWGVRSDGGGGGGERGGTPCMGCRVWTFRRRSRGVREGSRSQVPNMRSVSRRAGAFSVFSAGPEGLFDVIPILAGD